VALKNKLLIFNVTMSVFYRGCQKNVAVFKRFFSTTPYAALPYLGTLLCESGISSFTIKKDLTIGSSVLPAHSETFCWYLTGKLS
jgi:hypothetical protein